MDIVAVLIAVIAIALAVWQGSKIVDRSEANKVLKKEAPLVLQWKQAAKQPAIMYGLPWQIILAIIWQESKGDPNAIGGSGEIGLMQLKPIALEDLKMRGYGEFPGWKLEPETNIMAGTAYLHLQYQRTDRLADALGETKADSLEAYNEGHSEAVKDVAPDEYSRQVIQKAKILGW